MDDSEILELVKDGVIEADDVDDFQNLDEELQELIAQGEVDFDDVRGAI